MRIHFLGIGGIAMGNLAAMLKQQGHQVSGSDHQLYPPMSDKLQKRGIPVENFSAKNLKGADLCIVGNVISRGNAELESLLNQPALNYMSMPQALWKFFLKEKLVIACVGTHGKTTSSFLLDHILDAAGLQSSLFAGGVRGDGMEGFRLAKGEYFVIEGDEYDSAFFDKGPKFLHYRPRYLLLNSVEYDHADIYPDPESYALAFQRLLQLLPEQGLVVACKSNVGVRRLLRNYKLAPIQYYDSFKRRSQKTALRLTGAKTKGGAAKKKYDLSFIAELDNFALKGEHNRNNALGAALLALHLGLSLSTIQKALQSFPGVLRRQQVRFQSQKRSANISAGSAGTGSAANSRASNRNAAASLIFIEDFAHHPGALAASLAAMRENYPRHRLHVLFEPRSATSHRKIYQAEYTQHFAKADRVYLCEVFNLKKVSAQERLDVRSMVKTLNHIARRQRGRDHKKDRSKIKASFSPLAFYGKDPQSLLELFQKNFRASPQGDLVLALSNGSFGGIYTQIEKFLVGIS